MKEFGQWRERFLFVTAPFLCFLQKNPLPDRAFFYNPDKDADRPREAKQKGRHEITGSSDGRTGWAV
ncbi:MAG: hypothetical protein AB2606_08055 [Candidatus Thiodiazotropha taylori]